MLKLSLAMIKIGGSKDSASALMAYPGFGCLADRDWRIHVSGLAWQTPVVLNMRHRMMIRVLGGMMQATPDEIRGEVFQTRIAPFMAEADHRKSILISINGKSYPLRKRTRRNGHFSEWIHVAQSEVERSLTDSNGLLNLKFTVSIEGREKETAQGIIHLHQRKGLSVVSDIDDTIKDSGVSDRRELLANTFLREFRSIDGMADVYQGWAEEGAGFHYVSSSPWQLFSSLQQMHSVHGFPDGTMHLRNFRLRDQILQRVIIRRKGKASSIRLLMKSMPDRDFVLVGDSGEKDPKIYWKICRQFGERVKAVFIREVPERPLENELYRKLRDAVPSGICGKFSTAEQLSEISSGVFRETVLAQ